MAKQHLFVMDPLENLNKELDTSLRVMEALAARGHQVFATQPQAMSWQMSAQKASHCQAQELRFDSGLDGMEVLPVQNMSLAVFDAIHMRKDPPFDMDYVTCTWLLDASGPQTKLYNQPSALRGLNEKLATFLFPEDSVHSLLSNSTEEILSYVQDQANGDGIIKPLDLFGGRGVHRVELGKDRDKATKLVNDATSNGQRKILAQPFLKAVFDGEVRAFTAFGEPIAWCLKKPAQGNFLANTREGATLETYEPTSEESQRITRVSKELSKLGVHFVGYDVIGGLISEINITSPRLLRGVGDVSDYYGRMADLVVKDLGS